MEKNKKHLDDSRYLSFMREETRRKRKYYSSREVQKHLNWVKNNLDMFSKISEQFRSLKEN